MESKAYVLDSSIVVKLFVNEQDSDEAILLLKHLHDSKKKIVVPDLILYELANSLRWNKKFTAANVEEALKTVSGFGFILQVPTFELLRKAIEIAYSAQCTVYDAIFLALAKENEGILITADEKFAKQVKGNIVLLKNVRLD